MNRLLFVAAMVFSSYSIAEPHGGAPTPKQPEPKLEESQKRLKRDIDDEWEKLKSKTTLEVGQLLGDPSFRVREAAQRELAARLVKDKDTELKSLRAFRKDNADPEVQQSLQTLIGKFDSYRFRNREDFLNVLGHCASQTPALQKHLQAYTGLLQSFTKEAVEHLKEIASPDKVVAIDAYQKTMVAMFTRAKLKARPFGDNTAVALEGFDVSVLGTAPQGRLVLEVVGDKNAWSKISFRECLERSLGKNRDGYYLADGKKLNLNEFPEFVETRVEMSIAFGPPTIVEPTYKSRMKGDNAPRAKAEAGNINGLGASIVDEWKLPYPDKFDDAITLSGEQVLRGWPWFSDKDLEKN